MTNLPHRILVLAILSVLGASQLCAGGNSPVESVAFEFAPQELSDDRLARASLAHLTGCFAVRYQFTDDGRSDFFFDDGVEYMDIRPHGQGFLARNYLVHSETFLHWTQEWQPIGDGRWLLTVRSGDGSLRYRSDGVWRFNQWEGRAALASKPTRDGLREDYTQLLRRNTMQFTDGRWVQSEVNSKLTADGTPVASELGWITYTRRDSDELCAPAMDMAVEME